ncbi:hypothetical protein MCOR27_006284 [Pyricularia oryzae]|uniref:Uncharacterized protein n=1 Tax=Pyricularia grisea TaxID=148305 RepID=A0ABQ8NPY8_PYRGI|nr:hypothetical protein MCOR01_011510 [Pyricularia oryzae]KAI6300441.1 hypothetical protein MCOR33_003845 [Pyricularia grisea]KAI6262677.1 hypothetical protein MCOR19_001186 [Pyricularia oryzae]KAI6276874.1 hypothetical protein MCOR27_006284 [Pyricularia oryzae]KAI6277181.1 hypothetical protein MCOR26_005253 [Pyricularia oryzae]
MITASCMVKLMLCQFRIRNIDLNTLGERYKVAMERAWIKLRFCHFGIAATVSRDPNTDTLRRTCIRVGSAPASTIPDWVAATFRSGPTEDSLGRTEESRDACQLSVIIPELDPHSEFLETQLILRSPAWLIDDNGALGLLNALVMFAANDIRRPVPEILN